MWGIFSAVHCKLTTICLSIFDDTLDVQAPSAFSVAALISEFDPFFRSAPEGLWARGARSGRQRYRRVASGAFGAGSIRWQFPGSLIVVDLL